jgi:serine/threonine protein kinase
LPRLVPTFPEDKTASGPAVPDPRDDVYGLACVAYELFAGKHPFNSNTALEALAAGLKPAPIPRLDAKSWDALVRGLALRREQRTTSIAAFLADLGVTGRERLRRDDEDDRSRETDDDVPVVYETPRAAAARPYPTAARPAPRAPSARPLQLDAPYEDDRYELYKIRREDPSRSSIRWLAWAAALAIGIGAAAYWKLDWVQEHAPEWIAAGRTAVAKVQTKVATPREILSEPPAASADAPTPSPNPRVADAAPPSSAPTSAPPAGSAPPPKASTPPAGSSAPTAKGSASGSTQESAAQASSAPPAARSTPAPTIPPPVAARPAPESASNVAPPSGDAAGSKEASAPPKQPSSPPPATTDANASVATQAQPTVAAAGPPAPETFEPEKSVVVVSEAASSAAITIRRQGGTNAGTTFVWWTSDGTAVADEDYINLGARIERLAAGEPTRTIHVPLIHDPKRKGQGSFYVNVRSGQGKRDDPAQRVEVVISR